MLMTKLGMIFWNSDVPIDWTKWLISEMIGRWSLNQWCTITMISQVGWIMQNTEYRRCCKKDLSGRQGSYSVLRSLKLYWIYKQVFTALKCSLNFLIWSLEKVLDFLEGLCFVIQVINLKTVFSIFGLSLMFLLYVSLRYGLKFSSANPWKVLCLS